MFVIASAHKVTVRNGGGKWDDFLLQLCFRPDLLGLKVAGPPIFHFGNRTRNGGFVNLLPGQFTLPETNISPLKMGAPWKRRFLLETIIFMGYVSFRECT